MSNLWYYVRNGQRMPPVSLAELKQLVTDGTVGRNDLVWTAGMPKWVRAETVEELFPKRPKPAPSDKLQEVRFPLSEGEPLGRSRRQRLREEDEVEERPRRREEEEDRPRRRREEDEDFYQQDDEDRPRRRRDEDDTEDRPRRRKKSNLIPILAIAGGGIGLIILAVVVIVVVAFLTQETGTRSWSLGKGQASSFRLTFKANHKVEIWVTSDKNSDVDLFVFDEKGNRVAVDEGDSKDCYVWFIPPTTQTYRVEVQNRIRLEPMFHSRNGPNSGTLRFKETPVGGGDAGDKNPPQPPPVVQAIPLPAGASHGGQITDQDRDPRFPDRFAKVFTYHMTAGQLYLINLESRVFDAFLRLEDNQGKILAEDDDGAGNLNARITYRPERTDTYKIIATSLGGNQLGPYTLRVQP